MFDMIPFTRFNSLYSPYNAFGDMEEFERNFFKNAFMNFKKFNEFKTDIEDAGKCYKISIDMPGFKKEDVAVEINRGALRVSAKREEKLDENGQDKNYIIRERSYGSFARSFDISDVDCENIKVKFKDGVLKITLPKKEHAQEQTARKIEIE